MAYGMDMEASTLFISFNNMSGSLDEVWETLNAPLATSIPEAVEVVEEVEEVEEGVEDAVEEVGIVEEETTGRLVCAPDVNASETLFLLFM